MIATPLGKGGGPLFPIRCPICDRQLGSLYRNGLSMKAYATRCSDRCMVLWSHAYGRAGWRDLPPDLRQVQLATWMLDHEAVRKTRAV